MKNFLAFIFGSIFSLGLMISGMSNPKNVLDFLDLFGQWNPSLAFVMIGAILIAIVPFQRVIRAKTPRTIFNEPIELPKQRQIDAQLIIGSLLFGLGWGISGICPGPGFTLIGLGHYQVFYFIGAMLISVFIYDRGITSFKS